MINDSAAYFEDHGYQKLLDRMFDLLTAQAGTGAEHGRRHNLMGSSEPRPSAIRRGQRQLRVPFDKPLAEHGGADVEHYLARSCRTALMEQVASR